MKRLEGKLQLLCSVNIGPPWAKCTYYTATKLVHNTYVQLGVCPSHNVAIILKYDTILSYFPKSLPFASSRYSAAPGTLSSIHINVFFTPIKFLALSYTIKNGEDQQNAILVIGD